VLNAARHVVFLVTGTGKAAVIERILAAPEMTEAATLPAQRVRPADGRVTWILDKAAGEALS
jgi:6-phosphogluconolactonase